ncbi:hypothetical protein XENOCAPTIV_026559, partial [Xenoophorus captivus]
LSLSVIRPLRDITAKAGETVLFECHVIGPKDTDVDWLADGKLIQPALLNCKMHFDGRKCRLLLNSVHEDDSGTAKLEKMPSIPEEPEVPENEVERFTMPDFIKPLYDLDVIEGKEAVLKCKVAGLPYPTIAWFHNGKRIESTEDRKMMQCRWTDMHMTLNAPLP